MRLFLHQVGLSILVPVLLAVLVLVSDIFGLTCIHPWEPHQCEGQNTLIASILSMSVAGITALVIVLYSGYWKGISLISAAQSFAIWACIATVILYMSGKIILFHYVVAALGGILGLLLVGIAVGASKYFTPNK